MSKLEDIILYIKHNLMAISYVWVNIAVIFCITAIFTIASTSNSIDRSQLAALKKLGENVNLSMQYLKEDVQKLVTRVQQENISAYQLMDKRVTSTHQQIMKVHNATGKTFDWLDKYNESIEEKIKRLNINDATINEEVLELMELLEEYRKKSDEKDKLLYRLVKREIKRLEEVDQ